MSYRVNKRNLEKSDVSDPFSTNSNENVPAVHFQLAQCLFLACICSFMCKDIG